MPLSPGCTAPHLIALAFTLCIELARAEEPVKPALPPNESALTILRSLRPNEARIIGKARVVGEFNDTARQWNLDKTGPRGRDYSIRMVWAPERQRALFCGANHGVPHRLNDVWEFDLAAMSWVLLYAPDNARDYGGLGKDASDVEFKDGILVTKRGGPAVIAHTWWGLTYDTERRRLLFMDTWVTNMRDAVTRVGGDPTQLYAGPPLWAFSPQEARWQMLKTSAPFPKAIFGGMLEFIPELKGAVWHANNWQMHGTWLHDPAGAGWKNLGANGSGVEFEKQSPPPEQVGCYDSKRRLLIAHCQRETFHYSVPANSWKKVLSLDKDSPDAPWGHDAFSPMYLDPLSGHALLVEFKHNTLWAYDPDAVKWTKLQPDGDAMPDGSKRLAYFDPAQNVFVIIHDTTVWAYRYRAP